MQTTEPLPEQLAANPRRPRRVALIAATVVIAIGAVIATLVGTGSDDLASAAPLSQVQTSCTEWTDSPTADAETRDRWCTDMFAWMGDHPGSSMMGGSRTSMMDNMMWQGSKEMGKACREWVSDQRSETGDRGLQQCDAMLVWMDGHMPSEGGQWMMQNR